MKRKVNIQITNDLGKNKSFILIEGYVTVMKNSSDHDLAGKLFALEFTANNHSELPMRTHITLIEEN